jgi:hypothetical protein
MEKCTQALRLLALQQVLFGHKFQSTSVSCYDKLRQITRKLGRKSYLIILFIKALFSIKAFLRRRQGNSTTSHSAARHRSLKYLTSWGSIQFLRLYSGSATVLGIIDVIRCVDPLLNSLVFTKKIKANVNTTCTNRREVVYLTSISSYEGLFSCYMRLCCIAWHLFWYICCSALGRHSTYLSVSIIYYIVFHLYETYMNQKQKNSRWWHQMIFFWCFFLCFVDWLSSKIKPLSYWDHSTLQRPVNKRTVTEHSSLLRKKQKRFVVTLCSSTRACARTHTQTHLQHKIDGW